MKTPEEQKKEILITKMALDLLEVKKFVKKLEEIDIFNKTVGYNGKDGMDGKDGEMGPEGPQGERGPKGRDGEDGKDAEDVDTEEIVRLILQQIPVPKDGEPGRDGITPVKGVDYFTENDIKEIIKLIKPVKEDGKIKGLEKTLEEMKGKKFKLEDIEGLDQTISAFRNQLANGYLHGGGDTISAGANITITDVNGKKQISANVPAETQNLQAVTDLGNITTNSIEALFFKTTGGTSSQFVKADGSLDSTTYAPTSALADYLKINQTTPQTTVGTFTFPSANITNPVIPDATTKFSVNEGDMNIIDSTQLGAEEILNSSFAQAGAVGIATAPDNTTDTFKYSLLVKPSVPLDGQRIHFRATTLPAGISGTTLYYVVNRVRNVSFQVSLTLGGAPVTFTTNGTSVFYSCDWIPTRDCTYDLTNGKAVFAYSAGGVSSLAQSTFRNLDVTNYGDSNVGGVQPKVGTWYRLIYTVSGSTGSPVATLSTDFADEITTLDVTDGQKTVYIKSADANASSTNAFTIYSTLTAGQGFTLDGISLKSIIGGREIIQGSMVIGNRSDVNQVSALRINAPDKNRIIDMTRIVTAPNGAFPTSVYDYTQLRYYVSGPETIFSQQVFITDVRYVARSASGTADNITALSGQINSGASHTNIAATLVGVYNQIANSKQWHNQNADFTEIDYGVRQSFQLTPWIDVGTRNVNWTMYGNDILLASYSPSVGSGTATFNYYGTRITGNGSTVAGVTSTFYAIYNSTTGFDTNWFLYNNTANNNFLGTGQTNIGAGFGGSGQGVVLGTLTNAGEIGTSVTSSGYFQNDATSFRALLGTNVFAGRFQHGESANYPYAQLADDVSAIYAWAGTSAGMRAGKFEDNYSNIVYLADQTNAIKAIGISRFEAPSGGNYAEIGNTSTSAIVAGKGGSGYAALEAGDGTNYTYLHDGTYSINSTGQSLFTTSSSGGRVLLAQTSLAGEFNTNGGYNLSVKIADNGSGGVSNAMALYVQGDSSIGGNSVAHFEDANNSFSGQSVKMFDGTYAINATGPSLLSGALTVTGLTTLDTSLTGIPYLTAGVLSVQAPVADGTYTIGARLTLLGTDGTITITNGVITAITQAT